MDTLEMLKNPGFLLLLAAFIGCSGPAPEPGGDAATLDMGNDAAIPVADASEARDSDLRDLSTGEPPDVAVDGGSDASDVGRDMSSPEDMTADSDPDMAPCVPPVETPPVLTELPLLLSETGLYSDVANEVLASDVQRFEPRYVLWSDGAAKDRFVWLPPCETIDNTDQDNWSFPIGTRLWKTFTRDGVRIETRLITRWGPGREDYHFAAYLWRDDGTDADYVELGVMNAKGTPHDVPAVDQCQACHGRLPEPYLGFGAIMLTHQQPGVSIATLSGEGRLAVPAPAGFEVPGTDEVRRALGYLHANCSNCHNESSYTTPLNSPFSLRVEVGDQTPEDTGTYRTAVGEYVTKFVHPDCITRVLPGDPDASCVFVRMSIRGSSDQMPVTGTEIVHPEGL
ncbi:MAG: hypothetical protein R3324_15410, partial [Halobacteriales archaeon]|nr:hypothetical protein [Halobacteriales archaeon]